MNFKIENNFLDITNYPSIERHLQDMARKGWLISKIILGSLFIYKRIEPEELDFSITPYEVETAFTRKTKEELEEFNSVCKSVGWNYATKSYDLHIYFKEKGSEALDIQTDDEEEFKTLEFIGKKYMKGHYILIPILLFNSWILLGGLSNNIYSMKDGFTQIVAPFLPLAVMLSIVNIVNIKRFLKLNRKNVDTGKSIEYSDSKFYFYRITFFLSFIMIFFLIIFMLYASIVLKNKFILIGLIPTIIGGTIGICYRVFVKPSKIELKYKKIGLVGIFFGAAIISIFIFGGIIISMVNKDNHIDNSIKDGYLILSVNDFDKDALEESGDLMQQASILIPKSYEYYSYGKKYEAIRTEYSKALTEDIAKNLVNRYIKQAANASLGRYGERLEFYFNEGIYDDYLSRVGFKREDFDNLKGKDIKEAVKSAQEIIKQRAIVEDKENLWNLDEVHFLDYNKMEIVLRKGKEVFYLEGKDFSDRKIIKIAKDNLRLN